MILLLKYDYDGKEKIHLNMGFRVNILKLQHDFLNLIDKEINNWFINNDFYLQH